MVNYNRMSFGTQGSEANARSGLEVIRSAAAKRGGIGWSGASEQNVARARETDMARNLESAAELTIPKHGTTDLRNQLESALRLSGAVAPENGIYNATVFDDPGSCTIVVNQNGMRALTTAIGRNRGAASGIGG